MQQTSTIKFSLYYGCLALFLFSYTPQYSWAQCSAANPAAFLTCLNTAPPLTISVTSSYSVDLTGLSLAGYTIDVQNRDLTITGDPVAVNGNTTFTGNGAAGSVRINGTLFNTSGGNGAYLFSSLNAAMDNSVNNTLQKAVNAVLGILPVTLSSFNANLQVGTDRVLLQWETSTELNNEKFIIETSTEGEVFQRIGEIAGAGTTTEAQRYQYLHHTPGAGVNYYRLKQVDFDGTYAYSKVLAVEAAGSPAIFAFPNPVQDKLYVQYDQSKGPGSFFLHDALGRRVAFQLGGNTGNYELDLPADLPGGTYWLRVIRAGKVQTLPVVKP